MNDLAPIVLFVYNRPWHSKKTIDALLKNNLSSESELFIYSDAEKTTKDSGSVQIVRDYIKAIKGFKKITIIERKNNLGLASSIIDGVTSIVNKYGTVIVLEDDMVSSPHFLTYMNEALGLYADDERIISIHGYIYPVENKLPEAFFLPGADCWGWATWRRGWSLFNSDGQYLLNELTQRKLLKSFDFNGSYSYSKMLKLQIKGNNDSWAIRWYASAFLKGKLTLYPGRSLIHNIGNDSSGTHCGESTLLDAQLSETPINLNDIPVEPSQQGSQAFEAFFRGVQKGLFNRLLRKIILYFKAKYK
jgi:glycosyltransferase involved in cell wall biosynthesis